MDEQQLAAEGSGELLRGLQRPARGLGWPVAVPASALLLSCGVSMVIGLGFGAVPARRASLVQPVQALVAA